MDMDDLTIGDLEDVEKATGMPFPDIAAALATADEAMPPIPIVKALIWVTRRKSEPGYTLDDTRDLKLSELGELFGSVTVDPQ
jgi:hypothetical protein